ncbi:MAG: DUF3526 domain-containing protein, partial [Bacteroidota bacterium]
MRTEVLLLIARQFWSGTFQSKALYPLLGVMAVLLLFAGYGGLRYHEQNHYRTEHQEMARESWEANPDKHPHRMAHFGTFAFRQKHPLSIFDFGIESYTGNAVFLEAHRQNTANFSEAGFSTGLLRFGELSLAMILQTLLPLVLFFVGYAALVQDRENGTLKILLTQGATWREILVGKTLGLFAIGFFFLLPFLLTTLVFLLVEEHTSADDLLRFAGIAGVYLIYLAVVCLVTILVSASSGSSKSALVKLLGLWLLMTVLVPRTAQAVGAYLHGTPSKLEFKAAIEEEVIQYGDSHDPNDPYFNFMRDSVLAVHGVATVAELPFNYGGFIMAQGERISAVIYEKHQQQLVQQFRKQNQLTRGLALANPFLAIRNLSMALCGTDRFRPAVGNPHRIRNQSHR